MRTTDFIYAGPHMPFEKECLASLEAEVSSWQSR